MRRDSLIPSLLGIPTDSNKPGTALGDYPEEPIHGLMSEW